MLILARKAGETLMIGDDITVTVLSVRGNQVRLGVNAAKDISVHREEVYKRLKSQKNTESNTESTTDKMNKVET